MLFLFCSSIAFFPLFLFFLLKLLRKSNDSTWMNLPPSPAALPIIGNLHQLGTYPHRSLQSLSQRHGDVMLVKLGCKQAIVFSSADAAEQVLKTNDIAFSNRTSTGFLNSLLYGGKDLVFSPYGDYWRRMRSISVVHLLSNTRVQSFECVRAEEVALLIGKIKGLSSTTVNMSEVFMDLTNDIICRVAFGRKYGGDEAGEIDFVRLMKQVSHLSVVNSVGDFIPWLAWINCVNGVKAKTDWVVKTFDKFMERVLEDHSTSVVNGNDSGRIKDLVDVLLEMQRDNPSAIERDSIKGIILDMFLAGLDTTYITLEWAMSEIIRNHEVMTKLQQEVRTQGGHQTFVFEKGIKNMKYLKAVIKETLRLHPPLPLLVPRESREEVSINGYRIPSGIQVIVNAYAIARDKQQWDNPDEFNPERFMNSTIDFKGQDYQFIPFGSGRRGCPGIPFANVVVELVLANLFHCFDWALPLGIDGVHMDMMESPAIAVKRKNPLLVVPTLKLG